MNPSGTRCVLECVKLADVLEQIEKTDDWSGDAPGLFFGPLAHVTYHLGAICQTVKLLR